jgi:hypothetical protein
MIIKYYKEEGVPSEMAADGSRVTLPEYEEYDFPALSAAATAKVRRLPPARPLSLDAGFVMKHTQHCNGRTEKRDVGAGAEIDR